MTTRDIAVTVTMDDVEWQHLRDAAECAGMSLEAYVCWGVRLLAVGTKPGKSLGRAFPAVVPAPRTPPQVGDESQVWAETFTERLSHRVEQFRDD
ncbi:hypothetical protein HLB23_34610 [Nocardia uniformis]|uniref:Uncharacterized protein n=1 Tax=Nocardia uniformis TaxID=53432 RepID=A0A849C8C2_9NOCA|nr:hypothetical protein [Nocardia uniformis]NNH74924.1 hypothetical protein [Nocardia uniformis]